MGKDGMSLVSLCVLGQVHVYFHSSVCAFVKMILSEGWLNNQHTGACIIKLPVVMGLSRTKIKIIGEN